MLTLADLLADERAMLDLIANSSDGPAIGLDGSTLDIGQRIAWQQLWEDGLADFVGDGAGREWLILTERGLQLKNTGATE